MRAYLLPGVLGLLLGLLLHWTGFSRQAETRRALGLRRSYALRSALTAVGWAMALTAFLCWLAVIDVDTIRVLPLSAGALAGGALLGVAAGWCGFTPMTAFAGLGGGRALEALSVLLGCGAGSLLLSPAAALLAPLHTAAPYHDATLFRVTLDEPWLLEGGLLGQGCVGLLLAAIALCIPSPRPVLLTEEVITERTAQAPVPDPETAPEETFVAVLPGEEPLVVDTANEAASAEPPAPAEPDEPDAPEADAHLTAEAAASDEAASAEPPADIAPSAGAEQPDNAEPPADKAQQE